MGAEDFSYFLHHRPGQKKAHNYFEYSTVSLSFAFIFTISFLGCFFFVGGKLPGETRPHHKSVFDFDEVNLTYVAFFILPFENSILLINEIMW